MLARGRLPGPRLCATDSSRHVLVASHLRGICCELSMEDRARKPGLLAVRPSSLSPERRVPVRRPAPDGRHRQGSALELARGAARRAHAAIGVRRPGGARTRPTSGRQRLGSYSSPTTCSRPRGLRPHHGAVPGGGGGCGRQRDNHSQIVELITAGGGRPRDLRRDRRPVRLRRTNVTTHPDSSIGRDHQRRRRPSRRS